MKVTLRQKQLKDKSKKSLYLDYYSNGKREYEFLKLYLTGDKKHNKEILELANQIRAKRELELANDSFGFIPKYKQKVSLFAYIKQFNETQEKWNSFHNMYKHLKKFTKKDISFNEIDVKFIENFRKYLLDNISQNSAHTYFVKFRFILKQAYRDGILRINLIDKIPHIKQKESKREYLTMEELAILSKSNCQKPEIKRAFLFACFTGLRFSDLKLLRWGNINNDSIEIKMKKTDEQIIIPLNETAKRLLFNGEMNIYQFPDKLVFDLPNRWFYNEILKRWFMQTDIKKNASSHLARHTFATLNITSGNDLFIVQKLLGHKNIKHTQVYTKLIDEKRKEAIDKLPNIDLSYQ